MRHASEHRAAAGDSRALSCFSCPARALGEWCALDGEDLALLNRVKVANLYTAGQHIFYQGNPSLGLYCVESGTVAIRKTDAGGESVLVRLVHPGETLGYRTYFSGGVYRASAEALTDARVCFIDRSTVQALLGRVPALAQRFLLRMADDLQQAEEARLHAVTLPVRSRLAHLLLMLKDRFGEVDEAGNLAIDLPLARQDIAAMVGSRPETIARAIKSLEQDGICSFAGRKVIVPDLDQLLNEIEKRDVGL